MKTLYMTYGLPASGKTTWAKELQASLPKNSIARVNKDDLRSMISDGAWTQGGEKLILHIRDNIVKEYLSSEINVIVDDTNLAPKHEIRLKELAKECSAAFVKQSFVDVSLDECIARNNKRANSIDDNVIVDMYNRYMKEESYEGCLNPVIYDQSFGFCIIFDLDGTLANISGRNPYDAALCASDKVNESIMWLFNAVNCRALKTIILSGRSEDTKKQTQEWLTKNSVNYDELHMRKSGDNRNDAIVKKEMFDTHIKNKYNVLFIVDDRDRVVKMWRDIGLTCLQCNYGSF